MFAASRAPTTSSTETCELGRCGQPGPTHPNLHQEALTHWQPDRLEVQSAASETRLRLTRQLSTVVSLLSIHSTNRNRASGRTAACQLTHSPVKQRHVLDRPEHGTMTCQARDLKVPPLPAHSANAAAASSEHRRERAHGQPAIKRPQSPSQASGTGTSLLLVASQLTYSLASGASSPGRGALPGLVTQPACQWPQEAAPPGVRLQSWAGRYSDSLPAKRAADNRAAPPLPRAGERAKPCGPRSPGRRRPLAARRNSPPGPPTDGAAAKLLRIVATCQCD